jgi:hypothetical protein
VISPLAVFGGATRCRVTCTGLDLDGVTESTFDLPQQGPLWRFGPETSGTPYRPETGPINQPLTKPAHH